MPIDKYFGGHGNEVMSSMKDTYHDPEKAKQVFYATANKRKETAGEPKVSRLKKAKDAKKRG